MSCRCVIKFRNFHFAPRSQKWVQKRQIYHLAKSCILNTFNILSSMQIKIEFSMSFLVSIWFLELEQGSILVKKEEDFFLKIEGIVT